MEEPPSNLQPPYVHAILPMLIKKSIKKVLHTKQTSQETTNNQDCVDLSLEYTFFGEYENWLTLAFFVSKIFPGLKHSIC